MSKRSRRQNKERINRILANGRQSQPEKTIQKPKQREETFSERLNWCIADHLFSVGVMYLMGTTFYAWLGCLGGYSFEVLFLGFIGVLVWCGVTGIMFLWYEKIVRENNVCYSPHSWFRRYKKFLDNDLEKTAEDLQNAGSSQRIFSKIITLCLLLPIFVVVMAVIYIWWLLILVLDWLRIALIGFVNLCIAIFLRTIGWAYVFGVAYGSLVAFPVHGHPTSFMLTALIGGLIFVGFFFYKEARQKKYGTPYFPI